VLLIDSGDHVRPSDLRWFKELLSMRILAILVVLASLLSAQEEPVNPPTSQPTISPATKLNNEAVELLSKKKYVEAIAKLRKAVGLQELAKTPVDAVIKKNLITSLLGQASRQMANKDLNDADRSVLEAKRIDDKDATVIAYQGVIAFRRGYFSSAMSFLLDALRLDPKLGMAHEFNGMIQYKTEHIPEAITAWKLAIKHEPDRKKHLQPFIKKAEKELAIEKRMQTLRSTHFICKFGDTQNRSIANEVLKMLEEAYAKVGAEFREYPKDALTAVLYADREFQGATNAKGWAAGIYDGKIRVPIRNFTKSKIQISSTLIHEYTHFVVGKLATRVPAWLNEGLAQRMEGNDPKAKDGYLRNLKRQGSLKKLQVLTASFATMLDSRAVRLAYAQSLSFVGFLERTYGMSRIIEVLRHMGKGTNPDDSLRRSMGRSLAELEKLWLADL
jgi:tetratricopeptide (TPR) repeat protein